MEYTVYFNDSGYTKISEEEMQKFTSCLQENKTHIFFKSTREIPLYINIDNVTHIEGREEIPATPDIVTPPSPAEFREEKRKEEDSKDVTLDKQLGDLLK